MNNKFIITRIVILILGIVISYNIQSEFVTWYYSFIIFAVISFLFVKAIMNQLMVHFNFNNDVANSLKSSENSSSESFLNNSNYYDKLYKYYAKVRYEIALYSIIFLLLHNTVIFILLNLFITIETIINTKKITN